MISAPTAGQNPARSAVGNGCECLAVASCLGCARAVSASVVSLRRTNRAQDRVLNGCRSASTQSPPIRALAPASGFGPLTLPEFLALHTALAFVADLWAARHERCGNLA